MDQNNNYSNENEDHIDIASEYTDRSDLLNISREEATREAELEVSCATDGYRSPQIELWLDLRTEPHGLHATGTPEK